MKYTVPITFRLDGGKPKDAPQATGVFTPAEVNIDTSLMKPSLVVVDGKESEDIDKVMKSINPQTIEKMTVLKDKAAIEQYGEKAKDGVIIITTKK